MPVVCEQTHLVAFALLALGALSQKCPTAGLRAVGRGLRLQIPWVLEVTEVGYPSSSPEQAA